MILIPDWRLVLRKAWSIRFNLAAAAFSGLEVMVSIYRPPNISTGVFALAAGIVSILAFISRMLAQKEIHSEISVNK